MSWGSRQNMSSLLSRFLTSGPRKYNWKRRWRSPRQWWGTDGGGERKWTPPPCPASTSTGTGSLRRSTPSCWWRPTERRWRTRWSRWRSTRRMYRVSAWSHRPPSWWTTPASTSASTTTRRRRRRGRRRRWTTHWQTIKSRGTSSLPRSFRAGEIWNTPTMFWNGECLLENDMIIWDKFLFNVNLLNLVYVWWCMLMFKYLK